jgi:aryl-phospho-beta-D-glucosidase BglC (GH1 family)
MKRIFSLSMVLAAWLLAGQLSAALQPLPAASPEKLPRWRGFNLLEKFMLGSGRHPFQESDFQLISQWGFNFVRLPMDYRLWIRNGNWEELDEATLKEIDQAVAWGNQYGIHVCINFHRAPGYTVASPAETRSLWTDPEAQRVCAQHWAAFARRYKGIPSNRLSFDLMNEPAGVEESVYAMVVAKLVAAIRKEDPDRLIISDGLQWGTKPIPSLVPLRLAQATRGYTPMEISHYKANWVNGSDKYPTPVWPMPVAVNGLLLGPAKPEGASALELDGPFATATQLRLRVGTVSTSARLVVEADGIKILDKEFKCGPGEGEWKTAVFKAQWNIYQNIYDKDYPAVIPAGAKQVKIRITSGDWLALTQLGLKPEGRAGEDLLPMKDDWGKKVEPLRYAPGAADGPFVGLKGRGRQYLVEQCIQPWKALEAKGVGVMVGEWGAHNRTPHDVFLRWAEDSLLNWKEAGWGWALWNFRGSFGVMDSGRDDVAYETVSGHKLDRKLLELLQKY